MVNVHTATTALLEFLRDAGVSTANLFSRFEALLRDLLLTIGLPRPAQTLVLIAVTAVLLLGAARLLIGLLRIAAVLLLLLIALHLAASLAQGRTAGTDHVSCPTPCTRFQ